MLISGNTRAQLEAAFAAYNWLLDQGVRAEHIAAAGDSSGAILTFGVVQRGREHGLPLPSAVMTGTGVAQAAASAALS